MIGVIIGVLLLLLLAAQFIYKKSKGTTAASGGGAAHSKSRAAVLPPMVDEEAAAAEWQGKKTPDANGMVDIDLNAPGDDDAGAASWLSIWPMVMIIMAMNCS